MKTIFFSGFLSALFWVMPIAGGGVAVGAEAEPLTHAEVKSTVDHHLGDVKACMKEHGAATGKLIVKFGIRPDGHVVEAAPSHASSNAKLDRCIAAAFSRWVFPKPRGGVTMGVVYPFIFAQPKVGNLDKAQVVEAIRPHQPEVKACYDAALKKKASLAGEVDVTITVALSGDVTSAAVQKSTTAWPALDSCISGKIKSWKFPKPQGNGDFVFTFPFVLGTAKPAAKSKT
jgi:outer membrane biosynthesis protein TonB